MGADLPGGHTREILSRQLSHDEAAIDALLAKGIVGA